MKKNIEYISEPIVVKGSFNFQLKNIAKAFKSHGLIDTTWDLSDIADGFDAMFHAIEHYTINGNKMENITKYNEIDCKVIYEIVNLLRL